MEGDCPKAPRTTTEDYTPPPPPPPPLTNLPEASSSREKPSTSSQKDVLHMERNRREKMNEFYSMLQSMVPNLFPKAATRTRIVEETIAYIKGLEEVIVTLETDQKASREALSRPRASRPTQSGSSVDVTVSGGNMAFFGICIAGSRPRLAAQVLEVFEKHKAEVLSSTVACHDGNATITVTAKVLEEAAVERIKGELMII